MAHAIIANTAKLREVVEHLDGHSISDPRGLIEAGVPEGIIAPLIKDHKSNRNNFKETIFNEQGEVIEELPATVYELDVLRVIARKLGLGDPGARFMGRGFAARAYQKAIGAKLAEAGETVELE